MNSEDGARPVGAWALVAGSAATLTVSLGPVVQFSFAVFVKPLAKALGADRGTISPAPALALLMVAISTPIVGLLTDRYSLRRIVLISIPLTALGLASLGAVARTPWAFIALYCLTGMVATGYTTVPFAKAVSARFQARRGLALGVTMAGIGIGATLVPAFTQSLIAAYGWRIAYFGLAGLVLAVAFPASFLTLPRRQNSAAESSAVRRGSTANEALRDPVFWKVGVAFLLVALASAGVMAHLVALLTDRGVSAAQAAAAISVGGVAMIFGRLLSGFLLDRVFAPFVVLGFFTAPLAGLVVLLASGAAGPAWIATVLVGLGLGAEVDLIAYLVSRYMGQRAFGTIYGYVFTLFMVGNAVGPVAMGVSFAQTGSYRLSIMLFAAGLALACALVMQVGPYRYRVDGEPSEVAASLAADIQPA